MQKTLLGTLILSVNISFAAPCFYNNPYASKRFVCYSGKRLTSTPQGYVWYGSRGCFVSRRPCCYHSAAQYGRYSSAQGARRGYRRCNRNYPYHWGVYL